MLCLQGSGAVLFVAPSPVYGCRVRRQRAYMADGRAGVLASRGPALQCVVVEKTRSEADVQEGRKRVRNRRAYECLSHLHSWMDTDDDTTTEEA